MRSEEVLDMRIKIRKRIEKKGMPMNIRDGGNQIIADWFVDEIYDYCVDIDKPLGTVQGKDYEMCPKCEAIVGQSAYYCKKCGCWLREGGSE